MMTVVLEFSLHILVVQRSANVVRISGSKCNLGRSPLNIKHIVP